MSIEYDQICKLLPQQSPFVFVDRIIDYKKGQSITAKKCISGNEFFSAMHFPKRAIYPGIFILESVAQAVALLFSLSSEPEEAGKKLAVLGGVKDFQFRNTASPGDTLILDIVIVKELSGMAIVKANVSCGETTIATGQLSFGVIDDG